MADAPSATLGEALERAATVGGGAGLRFVDRAEQEVRVDWTEVWRRARATAGGLAERGVRPGDLVAIILPTGPAFFDAFFGAQLAGAIPVPLYPPVRLGRLEEYHQRTAAMLVASRAALLVTDSRVWRILGESVQRARPRLGCVVVSELEGAPMVRAARADDLAMVQFSSGTTVDPKPVALSHRNVLANVRAILGQLHQVDGVAHAGVSWLPLYHDMGLIGCVFPAVEVAGPLTLLPPELFVTRPASWLRALSRARATVSPAPNFAYGLCVDKITDAELDGVDLSAWRFALNGAEPVSPATLRRFVDRFARWGLRPEALTPVYGLAEASLAVTFSDWRVPFRTTRFARTALTEGRVVAAADGVELASVGRALPGIEVDAPTETVGPVRVRGPSVMVGYLHQPERTADTIHDGWLDTGDLGFLHDGELYISGRAKDVVILRGRNHAPHDIEQAVDAVPGVRTGCAAAVAWRDETAEEERLLVFVESREQARVDPSLAERCAGEILAATGLRPARLVILPPGTLPRTSSGKIRRGEALRLWLGGALVPPAPTGALLLAGALARGTVAHWRVRRE